MLSNIKYKPIYPSVPADMRYGRDKTIQTQQNWFPSDDFNRSFLH